MEAVRDAHDMVPRAGRRRQRHRSDGRSDVRGTERGFALVLALVALFLIYLLAAGGFALALLEARISEAHRVSVEAFYAADAALGNELTHPNLSPPSSGPPPFPGVEISVDRTPLLDLAGGHRLVHYRAHASTGLPGREEATRILQAVALVTPSPELPAAFLALAGVTGTGPDVLVDGGAGSPEPVEGTSGPASTATVDDGGTRAGAAALTDGATAPAAEAQASCAPTPPVAGVAAPPGGTYGWATIRGDPAVVDVPSADDGLPAWRLPWPLDFLEEGDGITRAEAGTPPAGGSGLLVAPGDLHLGDGFHWQGLVVVGGALTASGGVRIEGAAATGLGLLAGESPSPSWLGPGPVEIVRDECHLAAATAALAGPSPVPGTWSERF